MPESAKYLIFEFTPKHSLAASIAPAIITTSKIYNWHLIYKLINADNFKFLVEDFKSHIQ